MENLEQNNTDKKADQTSSEEQSQKSSEETGTDAVESESTKVSEKEKEAEESAESVVTDETEAGEETAEVTPEKEEEVKEELSEEVADSAEESDEDAEEGADPVAEDPSDSDSKVEEIDGKEPEEETAETESEKEEGSSEEVADTAEESEEIHEDEDAVESSEEETKEAAPQSDEVAEEESSEDDEEEDPEIYYGEIVDRANELVVQTDWAFVTTELANLAQKLTEGPESATDKAKKLVEEFQEVRDNFEEKKRKHYEEQNRKKEENLAKKKDLLKQLSDIVNEEKWTATKQVGRIKGQWENIKLLPQGEAEALEKQFKALMDEFEDHKVDRLVKKLQEEEENLELKLLLLDKMDALVKRLEDEDSDPDFVDLEDQFNKLISQWRKVGRVPSDKNQDLWDRFNKVQDTFNEIRFKVDKEYRQVIEKALKKKKKLIKEAEALVDNDNLADAARKVNKLHKAWKKTGNLPQKDENEMWDLFKAATDKFNEYKAENIDKLRDEEEENLEKKHKLIEKANEVKSTDDFDKGHQVMQSLMGQWKKIGPVPRKKSSKIWKEFKGAMDDFYDRRREAFKGQRKDQKENLAKKEEILEKLRELGSHDDPIVAVQEAKELQQEFKDIGYVPIKMKNKIWKEYREACDVIYDRYRSAGSDLGMEKKLANQGIEPDARKDIIKYQKERSKLKKEVSKLESEMIQYQEAKTYFKPTNRGNALKDELQNKIDKAEKAIAKKEDRLQELKKEIDQLKRAADAGDEEE